MTGNQHLARCVTPKNKWPSIDELVKSGQASEINTQQLLEANSRVSAIMGRFKVR
ncbi:hypothetical protein [Pseudomonas fluorescens]|uniref:hypothetical protein n=1 Tax=Pseudomonas fluorescens TaxID=294 RepID=UPI000AEEFD23|nr:hypothetical protein [Pseudomonas fluorescens]